MKKKIIYAVFSAFLLFTLSGCSLVGLDARALLSPPRANADQQQIYKLLESDNTETAYLYPKTGDYRSAITMYDFTGDGIEDAIGFYSLESGGAEVQFMSKTDGIWETIAKFKNPASQVDRICFGDFTGNGTSDIVIGWGNTQTTMSATLSAYQYSNDKITEYQIESLYGTVILTDFDEDGKDEIFLITRPVVESETQAEGLPAQAIIFSFKNEMFNRTYQAEADSSVVRYPSIVFGKISADTKAVVLDGMKADSSMTTQLFYFDNDGIFRNSQESVNTESSMYDFYRPPSLYVLSTDANGDGVIELPSGSLLPTITDSATTDSTSYLVSWLRYGENGNSRTSVYTLVNSTEGYYFRLPISLLNKITTVNGLNMRAVTYYLAEYPEESEEPLIGSPLFAIRVFSQSAWEQRGEPGGYEIMQVQGDLVYAIFTTTTDENYIKLIDEIKQNFKLVAS